MQVALHLRSEVTLVPASGWPPLLMVHEPRFAVADVNLSRRLDGIYRERLRQAKGGSTGRPDAFLRRVAHQEATHVCILAWRVSRRGGDDDEHARHTFLSDDDRQSRAATNGNQRRAGGQDRAPARGARDGVRSRRRRRNADPRSSFAGSFTTSNVAPPSAPTW